MTEMATSQQPLIKHIVLLGGGLAGQMCAAALSHGLPDDIRLEWITQPDDDAADLFYGDVTPPESFAFNLGAGVSEPDLILNTDTAFSFGSQYSGIGPQKAGWTQCFHLPLPIIDSVPMHHFLARLGEYDLEPYLISAMAARNGRFAHPPEQTNIALTQAEFGYQMDPQNYGARFKAAAARRGVTPKSVRIDKIESNEAGIKAIRFAGGESISADLYIDCSGPSAPLRHALPGSPPAGRAIIAHVSDVPSPKLGPPRRAVKAAPFGWQSSTPLQGRLRRMSVCAPNETESALTAHGTVKTKAAQMTLGRYDQAWHGNCAAIGQAAGALEPLTLAPIKALQRDIERLVSLIPLSTSMSVERREFNRLAANDYDHCAAFNRAFFTAKTSDNGAYWKEAKAQPLPEDLARKITQFKNRGLIVSYDLEPFNAQDWTILHFGLGHHPARYDRVADRLALGNLNQDLDHIRRSVGAMVAKLPPHDIYMTQLKQHLRSKQSQ